MISYTLSDNLTSRKIADEYFVLDRNNGMVHTFNTTGALIWEKVLSTSAFDEIIDNIRSSFSIDLEIARQDTFDFLLKLEQKGLIRFTE